MAEVKKGETISSILVGNEVCDIDAVTLDGKSSSDFQESGKLVTTINASSDNEHYPSAKCMWDMIGDVETLLKTI